MAPPHWGSEGQSSLTRPVQSHKNIPMNTQDSTIFIHTHITYPTYITVVKQIKYNLQVLPYSRKIWWGLNLVIWRVVWGSLNLISYPNFRYLYTISVGIAVSTIAGLLAMALRMYLMKIETWDKCKSGEDSSTLSWNDVEMTGRKVRHMLKESATVVQQPSVPHGHWVNYNSYWPEERAAIGERCYVGC